MRIDYSVYSIAELQEALRSVDGITYPENKAAIEEELAARKASGEYDREVDKTAQELVDETRARFEFAKKARVVIAWYLIMAPIITLAHISLQMTMPSTWALVVAIAVFSAFFITSHSAGIGLLKGKRWAQSLAIAVLAVQVVSVQSGAVVFQALSLAGAYLTIGAGASIGFWFSYNPGIRFFLDAGMPFQLGFNVLAIVLIYFLLASNDADNAQDSKDE